MTSDEQKKSRREMIQEFLDAHDADKKKDPAVRSALGVAARQHVGWLEDTDYSKGLERAIPATRPLIPRKGMKP